MGHIWPLTLKKFYKFCLKLLITNPLLCACLRILTYNLRLKYGLVIQYELVDPAYFHWNNYLFLIILLFFENLVLDNALDNERRN